VSATSRREKFPNESKQIKSTTEKQQQFQNKITTSENVKAVVYQTSVWYSGQAGQTQHRMN